MEDQTLKKFRLSVYSLGFGQGDEQDIGLRVDTRGILGTTPSGGPNFGKEIFLDQLQNIFKLPGPDIARCRTRIENGESFEIEVEGTIAQLKRARFIPQNA